jgi:hypothetical protein
MNAVASDHKNRMERFLMAEEIVVRQNARFKDLTGHKFGRLFVLRDTGRNNGSGSPYWECRCDCGKIKQIDASALRRGATISCGCFHKEELSSRITDLSGKKFGRLTVLSHAGQNSRRNSTWLCECECGERKVIVRNSLTSGHSKSCGCLHSVAGGEAVNRKRTPEYSAWCSMIARCEVKKDKKWPDYGGRGISVWPGWRHDYKAFLAHVGRRPTPDHSLDRRDNDGNYEPGNVRWATRLEQANNKRPMKMRNWRQASKHAYAIIDTFEKVIADYTGSRFAVACDSCTSALLLSCAYLRVGEVEIPKLTYISVPFSIIHAGGTVRFRDEDWIGRYQLKPYPIYDSARWMTSGMYIPGSFMCLSFHFSKHLPIGRGGAILLDDEEAADWLRRARFDGRDLTRIGKAAYMPTTEKAWRVNMMPPAAAHGLLLMGVMKEHNDPLPCSDYADLSQAPIFSGASR